MKVEILMIYQQIQAKYITKSDNNTDKLFYVHPMLVNVVPASQTLNQYWTIMYVTFCKMVFQIKCK